MKTSFVCWNNCTPANVENRAREDAMDLTRMPNVENDWADRFERVRRIGARIDTRGMTRPPRDPDERWFLVATGQRGPFLESSVFRVIALVDVPQ